MIMLLTILPSQSSYAAARQMLYRYNSMLEEDGTIYYVKTSENSSACSICKLNTDTGEETVIFSSKSYISNMIYYDGKIYYTTAENNKNVIYSMGIQGENNTKICYGILTYIDQNGIFYTVPTDTQCRLYKKSFDTGKELLIMKSDISFTYVKNIENTLYFSQYSTTKYKVKLYSMKSDETKLTLLDTQTVYKDLYSGYIVYVSDLAEINQNLYYQYGTLQGTGNFWYGVLVKINPATNKKNIISKDMFEENLAHDDLYIYCNILEKSNGFSKYNTKTGKFTNFNCKLSDSESYNVIDNKTYSAKPENLKSIVVSQFTSGTNKHDLVNNFVTIPFKQKKGLTYNANVKKLGDYFLISVETIDYNDPGYGWRGHYLDIQWFVTDTSGKLIASIR